MCRRMFSWELNCAELVVLPLSHRHQPHWFSCLTLAASLGTGEVQRRKIIGLIIMLPALKLISRICKNLLDLNSGKKDELTNTILRCRVEGNHSQIVYFSKSFVLILFWQNIKIFINYSYFINVVIAVCHQPS